MKLTLSKSTREQENAQPARDQRAAECKPGVPKEKNAPSPFRGERRFRPASTQTIGRRLRWLVDPPIQTKPLVQLGIILVCVFVFSLKGSAQDYSRFLHTSAKHASLACKDCHQRNDNSARPTLPGHKACTSCHLTQFTTAAIPMCSICHTSVNGDDPPLKPFPDRFQEGFNTKFDHAQHMTGAARPRNGCNSCHNASLRRGAAMTIPVGISAHNGCYSCHTPNAQANGRDLASCGVCHDAKGYSRTSTDSVAFRYAFSHSTHSSRQRLNCTDCHNYTRGLPQKRQVSSTRTLEHFPVGANTCASCHEGRRSFGGDLDFKNCAKCHPGQSFRN
jgi:c(7)-type cytochrome triheme protein